MAQKQHDWIMHSLRECQAKKKVLTDKLEKVAEDCRPKNLAERGAQDQETPMGVPAR